MKRTCACFNRFKAELSPKTYWRGPRLQEVCGSNDSILHGQASVRAVLTFHSL